MPSWEIKSFNAGFSDFEDKGVRGSFKYARNADIRRAVDSLKCQQALVEETISGMTALARFIVVSSTGDSYFFTANGKIFKRTSGGTYSLVYTETSESGNIVGAAEWYDSAGNTYLLWATNTRLNIKRIAGSGYTNSEPWADVNSPPTGTWPKTNLTDSSWHTMAQVNGTLQIANVNVLAMVGFDMSYTNNSLQLIPGNSSKAIIERGVDAIVGCERVDSIDMATMFQWDQISDNYNNKKVLPASSINALIDTDKPLAQVGNDGAIYYADFLNVLPITYFPNGGRVNPDGVVNDEGLALFGVFGNGDLKSGIYSYGKKRNNAPYSLNLEYQFDCDEIGSVKKIGTDIVFSYQDGSSYGVKKVDTTTKALSVYEGIDLVVPSKYYGDTLPTFTAIRIRTAPLPAGTSITCHRRIDKNESAGFVQANMEGGVTDFNTEGAEEAWFYLGDKGRIIEPRLVLSPHNNDSPEVYSIEVFFIVEK